MDLVGCETAVCLDLSRRGSPKSLPDAALKFPWILEIWTMPLWVLRPMDLQGPIGDWQLKACQEPSMRSIIFFWVGQRFGLPQLCCLCKTASICRDPHRNCE